MNRSAEPLKKPQLSEYSWVFVLLGLLAFGLALVILTVAFD